MHRDSREQTAALIWTIRLAAVGLLAALLLVSAAKAHAGIGFEYAKSSTGKAQQGTPVAFQFELKGTATRDIEVEVVRKRAGVVESIEGSGLPAGTPLAIDWTGLNVNGKPAKPGAYEFRVRHPRSKKLLKLKGVAGKRSFSVRKARSASVGASSVFPVRGTYNFGSSGARFGAGRAGHSHQGQDVMASCGTPLVAPEAGRVVVRNFQSSAGNYVVVRLDASGHDAVFMHLQKPSWAKVGTEVFPGQQIGIVGATGNAQGCHLHFELWTAPGWYTGGAPYDPLPTLKAWE